MKITENSKLQNSTLSNQLIESENLNEKLKNECTAKTNDYAAAIATYENELKNLTEQIHQLHEEKSDEHKKLACENQTLNAQLSTALSELDVAKMDATSSRTQIEIMSDHLNQIRGDYNLLEQHIFNLTNQIEQNRHEHAQSVDTLNKQLQIGEQNFHEVNSKLMSLTNEYQATVQQNVTLTNERHELAKKLQDLDMQITQKNTQLNKQQNLTLDHQKLQEEANKLKRQLEAILTDHESDKEAKSAQIKMYQKKREDLTCEIEELKSKLRIVEDKELTLASHLKDKKEELSEMKELLEKEKEKFATQTEKLNVEIQTLRKEKNEITTQWKSVKDFNQKFETHYELKKKIFKETEAECVHLKQKLDHVSRENCENKKHCSSLEAKIVTLSEEINFLREKGKTLTFENQQIRSHKEVLVRKLNETQTIEPRSIGGSLNSLNSVSCAPNLAVKPRGDYYFILKAAKCTILSSLIFQLPFSSRSKWTLKCFFTLIEFLYILRLISNGNQSFLYGILHFQYA